MAVLHNLIMGFRDNLCVFVISNALPDQAIGFTLHTDSVNQFYGRDDGSYLDFTHLLHI